MAKFIIRDSEGRVEKIVDKKMHHERKRQEGSGFGCFFLLLIVIGLIIYFTVFKDSDRHDEGETKVVETPVRNNKKNNKLNHSVKVTAEQDSSLAEVDTLSDVEDVVVQDVVREVVQDVVDNVSSSAETTINEPEAIVE